MSKEPQLFNYFEKRKHLEYYKVAQRYAERFSSGGTLLDVGAATQYGCDYLTWYKKFSCTALEKAPDLGIRLPGVTHVFEEFLAWEAPHKYNVVTCLQTLEHIEHAELAAAKLLRLATDSVVISVPYKWEKGRTKSHIHDPVDEEKLFSWFKRRPSRSRVINARLVQVYNLKSRRGKK